MTKGSSGTALWPNQRDSPMRQVVLSTLLLSALLLLTQGQAHAQPGGTIQVTFSNQTNQRVTFFLNGGLGLETRLDPGQSTNYTMAVDAGVQPTVTIYQPSADRLR